MAHEKDDYEMDKIPDYAMQPAREDIDTFDPTVYEKLFSELAPLEQEVAEAVPGSRDEFSPLMMQLHTETQGQLSVASAAEQGEPEGEIQTLTAPEMPLEIGQKEAAEVWEAPADPESAPQPQFQPEAEFQAELEPEEIPFLQPKEAAVATSAATIPEPISEPAAPVSAPAKIIPAGSSVISNSLKLTDIRTKPKIRLFIEEDILVPDVKPDLASVLSMDASVKLSEREIPLGAQGADSIKLTGDLMVSTLYLPERAGEESTIIAIESRIPFKEETDIKGDAYSNLAVGAVVENIDFTVINERKFKVKATVAIDLKEYRALNLDLFEGLRDEEVQMLTETIHLTDVAMRKTENMELSEELPIKDGGGPVGKILCYDVNVVENHKQITGEKAVINGTVYVNAMYLTEEAAAFELEEGADRTQPEPMLFQGKTEFTQFIKLDSDLADRGSQSPVGTRASFRVTKAELLPGQSGEESGNSLQLDVDVETTLELYKDLETDVVTDVYHHMKEMRYDTREVSIMNLCGSGMAEVSAREIVNIPEKYGAVDRVVYISGRISDMKSSLDAGKSITEGVVSLSMICIAAGDDKTPFSLKKDIPFRSAIDIPGIRSEMEADSDALVKELWYDKINNRQIEVNAGVLVNATVCSREKHPLINNVSFVESPDRTGSQPGMILYITREGDNVWRIAKRYRTTIENIRKINGIDDSGRLKPGTKLLIVK